MRNEIRDLEPSDFRNGFFETLAALREPGLTVEAACRILADRPDNIRTVVLLADGKVVSTATLVVERKFIHRGGSVGHIEDVATHRDHQHHGYASALVEHLIDLARAAHCYKVILDCDPALAGFYAGAGFRKNADCLRIDL